MKSSPGTDGTLSRPNKKLSMVGSLEMASRISSWASARDDSMPAIELLNVQRRDCCAFGNFAIGFSFDSIVSIIFDAVSTI